MGVYRRKDSHKYWISYSINGKLYREPAGETKAQAVALLAKRKTEIFEGQFFPDKKRADLNVEGLWLLWQEKAAAKKSFRDDRTRFKAVIEILGAQTLIISLQPNDIVKLKNLLAARTVRTGRAMAHATINRHLDVLRSALRYAAANGYLHRSPMDGVSKFPEHNSRDRICTDNEYITLLNSAYPTLRLAIVFGFHTGMRLSEITGLKWDDIDIKSRFVRLHVGKTKTGEGRKVPLSQAVVDELLHVPRRIDGYLFHVDKDTLSPMFTRLCRKLGIKNLRFHDLRHTAATNLRRAGADIYTIAAITGHKDLASLRRYNTITLDDMHSAISRISAIYEG